MNNEVAQATEPDLAPSSVAGNDGSLSTINEVPHAPSSTNPVVGKEMLDFDPDKQHSTEESAENEHSLAIPEAPDVPQKNKDLLYVPSRSSSHNIQPSPTSTGLSGATASDPNDSVGRRSKDSKASLSGKRRNGSVGSRKSLTSPKAREGNASKRSPAAAQSASPQQAKRSRGLLSILSCCGMPKNAQGTDSDEAVPMKKVINVSTQGRPTTASKPISPVVEASGNRSNSHQPAKELAQINDEVKVPADDLEAPALHGRAPGAPGIALGPNEIPNESSSTPLEGEKIRDQATLPSQSNPAVIVEAPTPIVAQVEDNDIAASETQIEIPPSEAVHVVPAPAKSTVDTIPVTQTETLSNVPPPPPVPVPEPMIPSSSSAPDATVSDIVEDKQQWLLPPIEPRFHGKKCLVLDLDETLVHSSFKILHQADFTIPVEIEGQYHNVYVIKRPGVDQFMKRVGELYEVVVFTASVSKYGDPLLDQLDIHHVVHHRLFRESCYNHQGNYVKDLSQVGRDLRETIIIDNSPTSYIFHPQHAVPISSWFSDAHDNELLDLIPVLEDLAGSQVRDVSLVLDVAL
ncbi:MAG: hypothetical protein M1818_001989 [Claussenomyces sp. TS43310]|nr:MAG: hypothetical protein M1818_001989 [Claussenomyces sp. TS43310]